MIENARITSTFLGVEEDHGLFTAIITLEGPGWGQCFLGYEMSGYRCEWIAKLLAALSAKSWESLPGTLVRVRRDHKYGKINAVGHIFEDRWFEPEKLKHL